MESRNSEGQGPPSTAWEERACQTGGYHGADVPHGEAHQISGKVVTMDYGFCVSKGITSMEEELGVYGQALVKKGGSTDQRAFPAKK